MMTVQLMQFVFCPRNIRFSEELHLQNLYNFQPISAHFSEVFNQILFLVENHVPPLPSDVTRGKRSTRETRFRCCIEARNLKKLTNRARMDQLDESTNSFAVLQFLPPHNQRQRFITIKKFFTRIVNEKHKVFYQNYR
jgi:hypothetical protein